MDGSLTASDVALLNNDGMGGWNGMIWLFAILALMGGGFGGWGNNAAATTAAALGYENLATSNEVQRGFDNQNLQAQTREILSAVNSGTAQSVAAINQSKLDNIMVSKDIENMVLGQIGEVKVGQAQLLANQNECCCNMRLELANNTALINATTTAQTQKILDAMAQSKIDALQAQVNQLNLQNAMNGVVRYPTNTFYSVPAPFFAPPVSI